MIYANPNAKFTPIVLFLITMSLIKSSASQNTENDIFNTDNKSLENKFSIRENKTSDPSNSKEYIFEIYSKENINPTTNKSVENEFVFKMENYEKNDPLNIDLNNTDQNDKTLDLSTTDTIKNIKLDSSNNMIKTIKLKNNFVSIEFDITKNDCLALFLFLDSTRENKVQRNKDNTIIYFDFRGDSVNGFDNSVNNYLGNSQEEYDVIHNSLLDEKSIEDIYLKIVCPYFSQKGEDKIEMSMTVNTKLELTESKCIKIVNNQYKISI